MKKEENNQLVVIPTAELLSEMESLVVFAGNGIQAVESYPCTVVNTIEQCGCTNEGNCFANCGTKCSLTCDTKGLKCIDGGPKYKIPCTD